MNLPPFTESMRHAHPIKPEDWVLEVGAHKGYDSYIWAKTYGCSVLACEPVAQFLECIVLRSGEDKPGAVIPMQIAVGAYPRRVDLGIQGELTGEFCGAAVRTPANCQAIADVLRDGHAQFGRDPALLQLNCEGGEFEILNAIANGRLWERFPRIQVQFHSVVSGHKVLRTAARTSLSTTHEPLWALPEDFDTTWDGWRLRTT